MNVLYIRQKTKEFLRLIYFSFKLFLSFLFPRMISPIRKISNQDLYNLKNTTMKIPYFEIYHFNPKNNHLDGITHDELPKTIQFDESFYIHKSESFMYDSLNEVVYIRDKIYGEMHPNPYFKSFFNKFDFVLNKRFFSKRDSIKVDKISAIIATRNDNNYYHFMTDLITKLLLLIDENIEFDILVGGKNQFSKIEEILDLLNFKNIQSFKSSKSKYYSFKKLIVPSMIAPHISPFKVNLIDKHLRSRIEFMPSKRLYISRINATLRKLVNELELINELRKYNFEVHTLEGLSITDQIDLFRQAEIVLSVHGAGLTNIIFSPKDTKVIEIFPVDNVQPHYYELANYLEMSYFSILGGKQSDFINRFEVEIDKVIATVEFAISNLVVKNQ